ncbi:UDP-N-acetylmuramoyl-L-alanine--D-glutamate ligase [Virgibacillus xinjiangensis]|uniref:UDP-N-acetylmuramoylalanine--D-glutamate ligase n=1 Tax=Virgibacillus xinjiangensis TaxID=393090 RepID=A0ABV7CVG6_9BACI
MKQLKNFRYSHVLVMGLARSGSAAARLLLGNGVRVRVNDKNVAEEDSVVRELKALGAEVIVGSHPVSVLDDIELLVKNPGIPYENPLIEEAQSRGIPIITEIELAGNLAGSSMIGITGSNGKTTTTTLTAEMLAQSRQPVKVAGNIGTVACEVAQTLAPEERMVIELSSFQLLGIESFHPKIAVLLNIYEAHLDYHKTMENYRRAKFQIFKNQKADDYLVFNADDPTLKEAAGEAASIKVPFSSRRRLGHGVWVDESNIYFGNDRVVKRSDIVLVGEHNLENILAAVAAAKLAGASNEGIQSVLKTFSGVEHRMQFVDEVNGRLFYNDSKATNTLATKKALSSFKQPVVLLAGGLDRGNDFNELKEYLDHVKAIVLFGETKDKLQSLAAEAGVPFIVKSTNVEQAAKMAYDLSEEGDIILLSPACASWDQYNSFEERGDMFIQAVHKLK